MPGDHLYHRALDTALRLVGVVRIQPDAPDHVLVSHFVYAILGTVTAELEADRSKQTGSEEYPEYPRIRLGG